MREEIIKEPGKYDTRNGRLAVVLGYNPASERWIGYVGDTTMEWSVYGDRCQFLNQAYNITGMVKE